MCVYVCECLRGRVLSRIARALKVAHGVWYTTPKTAQPLREKTAVLFSV